ncbi:MAG: site-specific integrase [Actinomycetota bacterium]|nr:site-specific integrase [Actinomycetota bacterium]
MTRRAGHLAVVAAEPAAAPVDWRVELMAARVAQVPLGEEWDPERLVVVPRPGGLLCPYETCAAPGCASLVDGACRLCRAHRRQFAASGVDDLDAWLTTGGARAPRRRYLCEELCAVTGDNGRCPRPATGASRLCHAHSTSWAKRRRAGAVFEEFMADAQPLDSLGECAVASCYLAAAYKQARLCEMHYHVWSRQGCPQGRRFDAFLSRGAQPANARVLSLRGLPELVRLELLWVIGCLLREQVQVRPGDMRPYVDLLRERGVASLVEVDPVTIDPTGRAGHGRFPRFAFDRARLAYATPDTEHGLDRWDLRVFGRSGHLDFSPIRQDWLRGDVKAWAEAALGGPGAAARTQVSTVQHQLHSVALLSAILASGRGGGHDPAALGRVDVERFLARAPTFTATRTGLLYSRRHAATVVRDCALVLRDARDMGLLPTLAPTFAIRRNDAAVHVADDGGRALPAHVVAQLDTHVDLLRATPGSNCGPAHRSLGVLGERAGEMAVLAYQILKGTGRRVGEVASLHLDCLDVDENSRPVLIYDNHKAQRMGRRLPLGDTALVTAIRAQQAWVAERFPDTPRGQLWLLPRGTKNTDGTAHLSAEQIFRWMRAWVTQIPRINAGTHDDADEPVPFDRSAIHPHAFRHTWAQTMADQGVAAPVLRDLMDHRSIDTTLGYYRVGDAKKREAMELIARHTIDNRGAGRPVHGERSAVAGLADELSWVAVPMGKCSEPTNVRAGGGACPIRYQCAACPHFESDPSYLPELAAYADDLRREREVMLATGAADWVIDNVTRQLDVIVDHIRAHEQTLALLPDDQRCSVEDASVTLRKARQSVPVAFGRRRPPQQEG